MTTRAETLLALATKCEEATTDSRELDALIARQAVPGVANFCDGMREEYPHYTASLDAALSLIGNGWWSVEAGCDGLFFAKVLPWSVDCRTGKLVHAATPALALCAASLRALAAVEEGR